MINPEKVLKKKQHILNALANLLARRVYSQISIEDVAAEAGMSKGGVRHYFPSKEEMFIELITHFSETIEQKQSLLMEGLDLVSEDRALVSTLFGLEQFLLDRKNLHVFVNMIMYGLEDEKIMEIMRGYIRSHLNSCRKVRSEMFPAADHAERRDDELTARLVQIILICTGLFQIIDPIQMETSDIIRKILHVYQDHPGGA